MARCAAGGRGVTNLPTALRGPGVFNSADGGMRIREVAITNTTTTAFAAALGVCTATGTQAGALTEVCLDDPGYTVKSGAFTSQSGDSTLRGALFGHVSIGAAVGAGYTWTFGENGIFLTEGTGVGLIIACPTGTAQFFDFYLTWDE